MKILSAQQMSSIDRRATERFGIPSIVLMENAAIAVADVIGDHYREIERVAIFCGPGKNGGDGFGIARHLENRGIVPSLFVVGPREKISGDSRTNLQICERLGLPIYDITTADSVDQCLARASESDLLVDAIFGTGLSRPAEGIFAETIRGLNTLRIPIVAVDLPSGLDASSSRLGDPVVKADLTVTFAQPKIAHVFEPAAGWCGEIVVADISIPRAAVEAESVSLELSTPDRIAALFPPRSNETHKGTYGHVAIIGGSPGKSGAAILACRGALRGGSGLVSVITDRETAAIIDSVSVESMTIHSTMIESALDEITGALRDKSAVLVGPGLADSEDHYRLVRALLPGIEQPSVIDASALNAFADRAADLNPMGTPRVITPHPGELGKLLGSDAESVNLDRVESAVDAARVSRCVVVLKGYQTIIAEPEGRVVVNPTGNPGMAAGGMGDVLGGLLVSLLGQGFDPFEAACAAVYVHGFAGDMLRDERADVGITAGDLADRIPAAIAAIRGHASG